MSGKATMKNFKAMMAEAKLPERSVPICLRGDLAAQHEELERQLEQAQRRPADSLAGNGAGELVDQIEAIEAEMREHTYTFVLRALPKPAWRKVIADHPPRRNAEGDVDEDDAQTGLNRETFFDDIIKTCTIDPELDDASWTELLNEKLTDRQVGELSDAAWLVNRGSVDVPFSRAASLAKRATADE